MIMQGIIKMDKETIQRVLYEMAEDYRYYLYKDSDRNLSGGLSRNYLRNTERLTVLKFLLEKEKKEK